MLASSEEGKFGSLALLATAQQRGEIASGVEDEDVDAVGGGVVEDQLVADDDA